MLEKVTEDIKYVSEMINESNDSIVKKLLEDTKRFLMYVKVSIDEDMNMEIIKEKINKATVFIDYVKEKIMLLDGPTDEEIIDGLDILKSNLNHYYEKQNINI